MMTLIELKENQSASIEGFFSDLSDTYKERLVELGFEPEQEVVCFRASHFNAPAVFQIGGSVFSLASDVAKMIQIKLV